MLFQLNEEVEKCAGIIIDTRLRISIEWSMLGEKTFQESLPKSLIYMLGAQL